MREARIPDADEAALRVRTSAAIEASSDTGGRRCGLEIAPEPRAPLVGPVTRKRADREYRVHSVSQRVLPGRASTAHGAAAVHGPRK